MATNPLALSLHRKVLLILAFAMTSTFVWLAIRHIDLSDSSYFSRMEKRWIESKTDLIGTGPQPNIASSELFLRTPADKAADVLLIVLFGTTLAMYIPRQDLRRNVFCTAVLFLAFITVNIWSFVSFYTILGFVYPSVALLVMSAVLMTYRYLSDEKPNQKRKAVFRGHLDPGTIDEIEKAEQFVNLNGERRPMTVLFADIRGFTSLSEKMTPTEVVTLLGQYFDMMTNLTYQRKGTLDKMIGDAVMCFWGHPIHTPDHALRSTICALEMVQAADELRAAMVLPGGARFEIGIAVNTGPMVVGNMGSRQRFNYTVMGDQVNLAARLEPLNKYYGTRILISEATYEACKDFIFGRRIDTVQIFGTSPPVTIYEPLGIRRLENDRRSGERRQEPGSWPRIKRMVTTALYGERRQLERRLESERLLVRPEQEEIATMYEHALDLYQSGNLEAAEMAFNHVLSLNPYDRPSMIMKTRIAKHQTDYASKESGFDPVFKFSDKS